VKNILPKINSQSPSRMDLLYKTIALFSPVERIQIFWLFVLYVALGLVEVAGVASIMPFIAVATNPSLIETNYVLSFIYSMFSFNNSSSFLIFLGFSVFLFTLISNCLSVFSTWLTLRFTYLQGHFLSVRLFVKYLQRPYSFFIANNTGDLSRNIYDEVSRAVGGVTLPFLLLTSRAMVAISIFMLIIFMEPLLALIVMGVLGAGYSIIYILCRRHVTQASNTAATERQMSFRVVNEALAGIKEIKVLATDSFYRNAYTKRSLELAKANTTNHMLAMTPRYALEVLAFGGLIIILLYLMITKENISNALPIVALYAFAGYRLMPALQNIYANLNYVHFNAPAVDILYRDLGDWELEKASTSVSIKALPFNNRVEFNDVTFNHDKVQKPTVSNISFTITANTTIAFVGATGSGKTTLVDLLLGLLTPNKGHIKIDGVLLTKENIPEWQRNIGYVPQQIFIADDSIANNIAFGVVEDDIDWTAVESAARLTNLHDFIIGLPNAYKTQVGDRGICLSGGQRQRIGIARALYRDPKILVLDEATSALDNLTEQAVMIELNLLAKKKTIILVAHRLTTIQSCDEIILLKDGAIEARGDYRSLLDKSIYFMQLAQEIQ
jgi:ABC-type bacteriocin/lantibiotic exporter with double-glycine peptidase domain